MGVPIAASCWAHSDSMRGATAHPPPLKCARVTIYVRHVLYIFHVHAHTHSFSQSHVCHTVAVLSCGFKPSMHLLLVLLLFVFFPPFVFLMALDDSSPGFPTEAVGCILFSPFTHIAGSYLVLSCFSHLLIYHFI